MIDVYTKVSKYKNHSNDWGTNHIIVFSIWIPGVYTNMEKYTYLGSKYTL